MDDNNSRDFDLNQEPMDSYPSPDTSFESLLLLDRAQELVEERIRQFEGGSSRERVDPDALKTTTIKRMDKALEINPGSKSPDKETRNFYDCNICLDVAIEPVLTCCGHLFCWACLYHAMNTNLNLNMNYKECPVCKGEVSENTITPIYGNYDSERVEETESGLKIPPRPKAHRVESIRQQILVHGPHNLPVESLRHIITSIVEGAHNHEGILLNSATSLSSLSSVLNTVERLIEELDRVITIRMSANSAETHE